MVNIYYRTHGVGIDIYILDFTIVLLRNSGCFPCSHNRYYSTEYLSMKLRIRSGTILIIEMAERQIKKEKIGKQQSRAVCYFCTDALKFSVALTLTLTIACFQ